MGVAIRLAMIVVSGSFAGSCSAESTAVADIRQRAMKHPDTRSLRRAGRADLVALLWSAAVLLFMGVEWFLFDAGDRSNPHGWHSGLSCHSRGMTYSGVTAPEWPACSMRASLDSPSISCPSVAGLHEEITSCVDVINVFSAEKNERQHDYKNILSM